MSGYDGHDLREDFDHDTRATAGLEPEVLPSGWAPFDPDAGEASGREAYIMANGHQVLISGSDDRGWFVLAYPEQGMADLCGFVRPIASDEYPEHADLPAAPTLGDARGVALGYMAAVRYYENDSTDVDLLE